MDKDSKVILEELVSTQAGSNLVDLVNNVKDSQKHFYLFLLNARNTMFSQSPKADRNKKSAANDKQNIMSVLTEFNNELVEYVNSVASLENLKATKEQMFPYSNTAILDDFKKINSLSLIIKLLKKDQRTEAEDIKIKVSSSLTRPSSRIKSFHLMTKRLTVEIGSSIPMQSTP